MSGGKTRTAKMSKALKAVCNSPIEGEYKSVIRNVFIRFAKMRAILYSDGCKHCRGCDWTEEPFSVDKPSGDWELVVFNFCPYCGRILRKENRP